MLVSFETYEKKDLTKLCISIDLSVPPHTTELLERLIVVFFITWFPFEAHFYISYVGTLHMHGLRLKSLTDC